MLTFINYKTYRNIVNEQRKVKHISKINSLSVQKFRDKLRFGNEVAKQIHNGT